MNSNEPDGTGQHVVSVRQDDDVTYLTLNRPDKLNAVNDEIVEQLLAGIDAAEREGSRVIVFSGEGRAFSAGFDLSGLEKQSDADLLYRFVRVEMLLQRIYMAPAATVALAHGRCFGAAADIFAACTTRIAAPGTTFRMPGLRFGVVLGTRRLAKLIGSDAARYILETSRDFDADEGLMLNFVQRIAEQTGWAEAVDDAARDARSLGHVTHQAMLNATRDDNDRLDRDMAALVRSAAEPGLSDRIREFMSQALRQNQRQD